MRKVSSGHGERCVCVCPRRKTQKTEWQCFFAQPDVSDSSGCTRHRKTPDLQLQELDGIGGWRPLA